MNCAESTVIGNFSFNITLGIVVNFLSLIIVFVLSGSEVWQRTVVEFDHNWINVTDLEKEGVYEFRVVAMNSARYETKSEPKTVSFISEEGIVHVFV